MLNIKKIHTKGSGYESVGKLLTVQASRPKFDPQPGEVVCNLRTECLETEDSMASQYSWNSKPRV